MELQWMVKKSRLRFPMAKALIDEEMTDVTEVEIEEMVAMVEEAEALAEEGIAVDLEIEGRYFNTFQFR